MGKNRLMQREQNNAQTRDIVAQIIRRTATALKPRLTQTLSTPTNDSVRFILNHFCDEISLEDMAGVAHLSKFYFIRKFSQETGITPAAFVQRYRMVRATHLLARTDRPIGEIARSVGYKNAASFSRAFRAVTGTQPHICRQTRPRCAALTAKSDECVNTDLVRPF